MFVNGEFSIISDLYIQSTLCNKVDKQKKLTGLYFDQIFKFLKMCMKSLFAFFGSTVGRVRFLPDELFIDDNVFHFFQRFDVTCEISIGKIEQLFKGSEVNGIVDHQYRHNTKPHAALKSFIKIYQ